MMPEDDPRYLEWLHADAVSDDEVERDVRDLARYTDNRALDQLFQAGVTQIARRAWPGGQFDYEQQWNQPYTRFEVPPAASHRARVEQQALAYLVERLNEHRVNLDYCINPPSEQEYDDRYLVQRKGDTDPERVARLEQYDRVRRQRVVGDE